MPRRKPTPHENAEAHARVMARLRSMTPEEKIESLRRAGIIAKTGRFTRPYKELEAYFPRKSAKAAAR